MHPEIMNQKKEKIIADSEKLEKKVETLKESGSENLHALTDFDRTLTKAFVEGQKSPTVIHRFATETIYLLNMWKKPTNSLITIIL